MDIERITGKRWVLALCSLGGRARNVPFFLLGKQSQVNVFPSSFRRACVRGKAGHELNNLSELLNSASGNCKRESSLPREASSLESQISLKKLISSIIPRLDVSFN